MSVAPSAYGSNPRGIGSIDSERFVDTLVYLDLWRSKKKRRVLVSQRAGVSIVYLGSPRPQLRGSAS